MRGYIERAGDGRWSGDRGASRMAKSGLASCRAGELGTRLRAGELGSRIAAGESITTGTCISHGTLDNCV